MALGPLATVQKPLCPSPLTLGCMPGWGSGGRFTGHALPPVQWGVTGAGKVGKVRLASPDMSSTLWQPEAVAVKVQAIGHTVGHTIGGHLAILNFWEGVGRKEQQQLRRRFLFLLSSPPASTTGSDGSIVGLSPQGRSIPRKQART